MNTKKGLMMMAAIAGLSLTVAHATDQKIVEDTVSCYGVNDCKGHGACHGKVDSCSGKNSCNTELSCGGKNSCKGKGITKLTKKECMDKKGKIAK